MLKQLNAPISLASSLSLPVTCPPGSTHTHQTSALSSSANPSHVTQIETGGVAWRPTVVAVRLVLVLGVGERQHRVGAAGQAGTPPGRLAQPPAAPEPHGALRRHHRLAVGVQFLRRAH